MIRVLETVVRHASASLELVEASGLIETRRTVVNGTAQVITDLRPALRIDATPEVVFSTAPSDLRSVSRPGRVILSRQRPEALSRVLAGRPEEADLAPPPEPPYPVAGRLVLPGGRFNARTFAVDGGGGVQRPLRVFRAPPAVRGDAGGVLSARLVWEEGAPASWAVVTVRLALPVADPTHTADRTYRGQADRRGEVRLALTGIPAPTRAMIEAGALDRTITLSVLASAAAADTEATDPDALPAAEIRGAGGGFAAEATFTIRPGGVIRLASPPAETLILRTP
ncbi:MAG: hypothetical protein AAF913_04830 [Pseudomonadota bacterium]